MPRQQVQFAFVFSRKIARCQYDGHPSYVYLSILLVGVSRLPRYFVVSFSTEDDAIAASTADVHLARSCVATTLLLFFVQPKTHGTPWECRDSTQFWSAWHALLCRRRW